MYGGKGYLLRRASPRYRVKWHGFIVSIPTMERNAGFKPVPSPWKGEMLSLHQFRIGGKGYLLRRASPRYRVKWHRFIWSLYRPLARSEGFEPPTPWFVAKCSTPLS